MSHLGLFQLILSFLAGLSAISPDARAQGPLRTFQTVPARTDRSGQFTGDENFNEIHGLVRDGNLTEVAPSGKADVVIVGGGLSGLLTAYELVKRGVQPMIIDLGNRPGGNARGEEWNGTRYSIGSAYLSDLGENPGLAAVLKELGLDKTVKDRNPEDDPVFIDDKRYDHIWDNGTNPQNKAQFAAIKKHALAMLDGKNGLSVPVIPPTTEAEKKLVRKLDQLTVEQYFEKVLGQKLDPDLKLVLDAYFKSAMNGKGAAEISAAAGLNFFVGDFRRISVLPGGNAALSDALLQWLQGKLPAANFIPAAAVGSVRPATDGVYLTYARFADSKAVTIVAKKTILCIPKFVATSLIRKLPGDKFDAMSVVEYRPYLVANVLLDQKVKQDFYDVFYLKRGIDDSKLELGQTTDIVFNEFTQPGGEVTSVLTMYRPFGYDGKDYLQDADRFYKELQQDFLEELKVPLQSLGLSQKNIVDIRITRFGHATPVPVQGTYGDKLPDRISGFEALDLAEAPIENQVFFIHQDNYALPAVESIYGAVKKWVPVIAPATAALPATPKECPGAWELTKTGPKL